MCVDKFEMVKPEVASRLKELLEDIPEPRFYLPNSVLVRKDGEHTRSYKFGTEQRTKLYNLSNESRLNPALRLCLEMMHGDNR